MLKDFLKNNGRIKSFYMEEIIQWYRAFIRSRLGIGGDENGSDLYVLQDHLFFNFLVYCLPVGLFVIIPGVFIAIQNGALLLASVHLICFVGLFFITFSNKLSILIRKVLLVGVFYFLSLFLINSLGYIGPGIFYLFFVTILISLFLPVRFAYYSIVFNAAVLICFTAIIRFKLFHSTLILEYTPGKWIAFSGNLIFASVVTVMLINKIFKDLQLKITNQTLLQERYRNIFEKSPLPMWLFDTESLMFLDVNEAASRNYGFSRTEFLSMTIKDIRPASQIAEVQKIVEANRISGVYYDGNSQHIKKNGDLIYVKIESNLLQLNKRTVRLVLATDITKQVEHQLEIFDYNSRIKDSESNLRAIFESALDGFVLLDANSRIKIFNNRASESMRFNKDRSLFEIGRSIFDYVETRRLPYFKEIINRVYSGQTIDYDRRYRGHDGGKICIRYTITPVWEDNLVIGACINGRDVSVHKLYLKNLEDQNKTFREISWMQSHLVRAPLARIMGLMPLFENSIDEQERSELVKYIHISTRELDRIILQICDKSSRIMQNYPVSPNIRHPEDKNLLNNSFSVTHPKNGQER
jgi:PAS domain S-box-containing protein